MSVAQATFSTVSNCFTEELKQEMSLLHFLSTSSTALLSVSPPDETLICLSHPVKNCTRLENSFFMQEKKKTSYCLPKNAKGWSCFCLWLSVHLCHSTYYLKNHWTNCNNWMSTTGNHLKSTWVKMATKSKPQ